MFINTTHEHNLHTLNQIFAPTSERGKIINYIFAIPSIHDRFEQALKGVYTPVDCLIYYLDDIEPLTTEPLERKDELLLQLGLELYNGTSEMKKGTFRLYDSTNIWNEDYMRFFYHILQMARPTEATA